MPPPDQYPAPMSNPSSPQSSPPQAYPPPGGYGEPSANAGPPAGTGSLAGVPAKPASVVDAFIPTNPLAAIACWTGVLSVMSCGFGMVLGPIALALGILSLKKGALAEQSGYGKTTSTMRSWIGIVTGIIGTLMTLGVIFQYVFGRH
jgi:hypothetical protein